MSQNSRVLSLSFFFFCLYVQRAAKCSHVRQIFLFDAARLSIGIHESPRCHRQGRGLRTSNDNEDSRWMHRGCCRGMIACKRVARRLTRAGINQKYEMRPAEFRYIYGGGQFNDTHSRSRVIVNISIRSTPTTHAYADKPCSQRCFM